MAYVYRHIRLDKNQPFYIGIGSDSGCRAKDSKKRNKIWKDIIKKTQYDIEILFDDLTWEQACAKEIEFIQLYGRICNGTGSLANFSLGGEGYLDPPADVRARLSKSKLGSKNPMFGKKFTNEHLDKLKIARVGKVPVLARPLIHIVTGRLFKNVYEAAQELGITHKALYKRLLRRSKKTPLKFLENADI
jgi:hypothetical protein